MRKILRGVFLLGVISLIGSNLGVAQGNSLMDQRLGLPPLQSNNFAQHGEWPRNRLEGRIVSPLTSEYFAQPQYLAAANGSGGGSGGGPPLKPDGTMDLEAISKAMDNPLGSLWIIFTQNDTLTLRGPLYRKPKWPMSLLLCPSCPYP